MWWIWFGTAIILIVVTLILTYAVKERSLVLAAYIASLCTLTLIAIPVHVRAKHAPTTVVYIILLALALNLCVRFNNTLRSKTSPTLLVTYKGKRYDLAPWAHKHPGGDVIWDAAGQDVEEFWKRHGVMWHADRQGVLDTLEKYKVEY